MKKTMMCVALVAALSLGACDRFGADAPVKVAPKKEQAKSASKKNTNQPVEDALDQIPPEMRNAYQEAFACEVKRNQAKGETKAINVTADYVHDLTARLKANPSLAKC